jgi:hypothetical protein
LFLLNDRARSIKSELSARSAILQFLCRGRVERHVMGKLTLVDATRDWEDRTTVCKPGITTEVERPRIAAHATSFQKAIASRFGSMDEIGMLDPIDARSGAA